MIEFCYGDAQDFRSDNLKFMPEVGKFLVFPFNKRIANGAAKTKSDSIIIALDKNLKYLKLFDSYLNLIVCLPASTITPLKTSFT